MTSSDARQYMESRGFTPETLKEFGISFLPKYGGQILIPVHDPWGNEVAKVARQFEREPKYLYPKGVKIRSFLFNFHRIKERISESGQVMVVEGPLDSMSCHQMGVPSLAAFGSSLTASQAIQLYAYGLKLAVLWFDWDEAGMVGSAKTRKLLESLGISTKIAHPPRIGMTEFKDANEMLQAEEGANV